MKKDKGLAWLALMAALLIQLIVIGQAMSTGIFYSEWIIEFSENVDLVAWTISMNSCLLGAFGPVSGLLCEKIGHRNTIIIGLLVTEIGLLTSYAATETWHLTLSFGVVTGCGFCLLFVPSATLVGLYFDEYKRIAASLVTLGGSAGGLIFAPMLTVLVDEYLWKGTILIVSGIFLNISISIAALPKPPIDEKEVQVADTADNNEIRHRSRTFSIFIVKANDIPELEEATDTTTQIDCSILGEKSFYLFFLAEIFWNFSLFLMLSVGVSHVSNSTGVSFSEASQLLTAISASTLFGQVLLIPINKFQPSSLLLFGGSHLISCVPLLGFAAWDAYVSQLFFGSLFGLMSGIFLGTQPIVFGEFYGEDLMTIAFGYLQLADSVGGLLGAPVATFIFSSTSSYKTAFYASSTTSLLAGVLCLAVYTWSRWVNSKGKVGMANIQSQRRLSKAENGKSSQNIRLSRSNFATKTDEKKKLWLEIADALPESSYVTMSSHSSLKSNSIAHSTSSLSQVIEEVDSQSCNEVRAFCASENDSIISEQTHSPLPTTNAERNGISQGLHLGPSRRSDSRRGEGFNEKHETSRESRFFIEKSENPMTEQKMDIDNDLDVIDL